MRRSSWGALAAVAALLAAVTARAEEALPLPTRHIVLVVSGSIDRTSDGIAALFDLDMLESLGATALTTAATEDGATATFEGVAATTLLDLVGAKGTSLTLRTLDDERREFALDDVRLRGAVLAFKRDGAYLDPEEQGPLALVLAEAGVGPAEDLCIMRLAGLRID
jgi:hypothetical protein